MALTPDELLERSQWDFFWAPPDAVVVDRPELLYIHCPRDFTYLNAVTRVRATSDRISALVDEVVQAHAGRRSRWPVLSIRENSELETQLMRAGYKPGYEHYVYAIGLERYTPRPADGIVVERVDSIQRLRDGDHVGREAFGKDEIPEADESKLEHDLETCAGPDARVIRFVAYDAATGQPISSGGINLYPALRFGFLWRGGTVPDARGRGAYSAVVASRIDFARRIGLRLVGLYARIDTSAPIVARQGFERHGGMVYWERGART